jgi:hypothetical protein
LADRARAAASRKKDPLVAHPTDIRLSLDGVRQRLDIFRAHLDGSRRLMVTAQSQIRASANQIAAALQRVDFAAVATARVGDAAGRPKAGLKAGG